MEERRCGNCKKRIDASTRKVSCRQYKNSGYDKSGLCDAHEFENEDKGVKPEMNDVIKKPITEWDIVCLNSSDSFPSNLKNCIIVQVDVMQGLFLANYYSENGQYPVFEDHRPENMSDDELNKLIGKKIIKAISDKYDIDICDQEALDKITKRFLDEEKKVQAAEKENKRLLDEIQVLNSKIEILERTRKVDNAETNSQKQCANCKIFTLFEQTHNVNSIINLKNAGLDINDIVKIIKDAF